MHSYLLRGQRDIAWLDCLGGLLRGRESNERATSSFSADSVPVIIFPTPLHIHIKTHGRSAGKSQATHKVCKVRAVRACVLSCNPFVCMEKQWECMLVSYFVCVLGIQLSSPRLLSHAPQLAPKSPQLQIKVRLTPGPLTYCLPTNS